MNNVDSGVENGKWSNLKAGMGKLVERKLENEKN